MDGQLPDGEKRVQRVQVIAHRTGWRLGPENTLAALQECIDRGFDWAEVDVRLTADGHHVLMHDAALDRTTTGSGLVAETTLRTIRTLEAGTHFGGAHAGAAVPTLDEALELAKGRLGLYLDCKQCDPQKLVGQIGDVDDAERVMVFAEGAVRHRVEEMSSGAIPLVTFFAGTVDEVAAVVGASPATILEVPYQKLSAALVEAAVAAGGSVECLALGAGDTPACHRRAVNMGVAWIMTDYPDQVRTHITSTYPPAPGEQFGL